MTDRPRRVSEIGEFALIDRLARVVGPAAGSVVLGIGDDVAALAVDAQRLLLVTCDAQVEGTHFEMASCDARRNTATTCGLGTFCSAATRPAAFNMITSVPNISSLA